MKSERRKARKSERDEIRKPKIGKIYKLYLFLFTTKVFFYMKNLERITLNTDEMGGKPCIRGLRMTVGTVIGLLASGLSTDEILKMYPYLQHEDLIAALSYAA